MVSHEFGHWSVAKYYGFDIKFRIEFSGIIPRGIWTMPTTDTKKQKVIAIAGFGFEIFLAVLCMAIIPIFGEYFIIVSLIHLGAYNYYAGDKNDFNWLR